MTTGKLWIVWREVTTRLHEASQLGESRGVRMPQDVRRRTAGGGRVVHVPGSGDVARIVSTGHPPENRTLT